MRRLALLEPLLVFGLIVGYIWRPHFIPSYSVVAIPAVMFLSHWLCHETPRDLGFDPHNWRNGLNQLAPLVIVIALLLLAWGVLFHTFRQISVEYVLLGLAAYLPWGLVQQYALNAFFLNRFRATLSSSASSLLAALLFSAAHAPNLFLMAITFALGLYASLVYQRTRNLYLLAIGHAILGMLLYVVVPDSVSHHLRVGPGWFRTDSP